MATYKDPDQIFAPLEVIERLLEIRAELGFTEALFLDRTPELADILDAYGFDIYAFSIKSGKLNFDSYSAPLVPGGDAVHGSSTVH